MVLFTHNLLGIWSDGMCARKVGSMGHNDFEKLCNSVGLICNSSLNNDSSGWDCFVEFKLPHTTNAATSLPQQAIQCFVQVKSTDGKNKFSSVKLSNLKRFCDSAIPCFFFFAEYNNSLNPEAIYLVHIDSHHMFDILKKAREFESKGETKLHKSTMRIKYNDSHRIEPANGEGLLSKIKSFIPNGMGDYVTKKLEFLQELGYEKSKIEVQFSVTTDEDYKSLVMASLGYENEINIQNIIGHDLRFGIHMPLNELASNSAKIKLSEVTSFTSGTIVFEGKNDFISFPCEIFASPLSLNAPIHISSFRIKTECFDMLVGIGSTISNIEFSPPEKVMTIFDLRDMLSLLIMISDEGATIGITLQKGTGDDLEYTMHGSSVMNSAQRMQTHSLLQSVKTLIEIASFFRIEKSCNLSIVDLFNNRDVIPIVSSYIGGNFPHPVLTVNNFNSEAMIDDLKLTCMFMAFPIAISNGVIVLVVTVKGMATYKDNECTLTNYDVNTERAFFAKDIAEANRTISKILKNVIDRLQDDDVYFINTY
ncbi:hypothetical protein ABNY11_001711 [Enterobacter roggenkampii]